jgi:glycosyltransferase involved in cell wall biosynthesis
MSKPRRINTNGQPARLTIAIPFYKGRHYLRRALESVLRQTHPGWFLIVCDDCGPDGRVGELISSYGDPRIQYVRNDRNLGMAGNWNRCLDVAGGDLVTLLHADDELVADYAAVMVEAAGQWPEAAAFFCGARIIDEKSRVRFSLPDFVKRFLMPGDGRPFVLRGRRALEALLCGNFIMCPTVCYRKRVLGGHRFAADWVFVLDLDLYTRLLLHGHHLVGLPGAHYAYRRHAENATTAYTQSLVRFREEARLYDLLAQEAAARDWSRAARLARRKLMIKLNLLYCGLQHLLRLDAGQAWEKLRCMWEVHSA